MRKGLRFLVRTPVELVLFVTTPIRSAWNNS